MDIKPPIDLLLSLFWVEDLYRIFYGSFLCLLKMKAINRSYMSRMTSSVDRSVFSGLLASKDIVWMEDLPQTLYG